MKYLFLFTFLLCSQTIWAYPQFIGHGYHSCLPCHYNPFGNGPLTDYGRAVGANAIADRALFSDKTTDEYLAQHSGFLYQKVENKWFRPSVDYRGLYLKSSYDTKTEDSEVIHMQADLNVVAKFGENDKYIFSSTIGYAPKPRGDKSNTEPSYRSREHYFGWRINKSMGIYTGMMDKVFGIRVPDHNSFAKSINNLNMNDGAHGTMFHWFGEKFDYGAHIFLGNLGQDDKLRQKGFSTKYEHSITSNMRLGASLLSSSSEYLSMMIMASHLKIGYGKGSATLFEFGQTTKKKETSGSETKSRYFFLQNFLRARRGTYGLITVEYFKDDIEEESYVMRMGPGFQYFLMQGVELRADIYNTRIFSDKLVSEDTWDITSQLHLWF